MKKRYPILLLEMVIALVIMAGVMGLLFTGFYEAIKAKNSVKKEKEKILTLQRLKLRFAILFKDIIDVKQISDQEYYIRYQGGVDPSPNFRSEIEAILKISKKVLTLTCWPEKGDLRREIFAENVESIHFKFFDEKEGKFTSHCPHQKPFMIKVILNEKEAIPLFL
ncbi:MAG: PulJ/GspJ family protein [Rhabdochlamydiaceae bacterium]